MEVTNIYVYIEQYLKLINPELNEALIIHTLYLATIINIQNSP